MKSTKLKEFLNKHYKKIILGTVIVTISSCAGMIYVTTNDAIDKPYRGVLIENYDTGNLDYETLIHDINEILNAKLNSQSITLTHNNKTIKVPAKELGVYYDVKSIVDTAVEYNKVGSTFKDFITRVKLYYTPTQLPYSCSINNDILDEYIDKLNKEYTIKAKNPTPTFKDGKVLLSEGKDGVTIDTDKLKDLLISAISTGLTSESNIEIPTKTLKPDFSSDIASDLTVLGSFSTSLNSLTSGRTNNIRLFSKAINGSVVLPGEEFSADKAGGSRKKSDGYSSAPMFVNGQLVNATAGGICQVTTTLYNALVFSDLKITERHPHSSTVSYSVKSRDAAIAKGSKDLRFVNNKKNPVIIQAYVSSDYKVVVKVWGINESPETKIKISTKNLSSKSSIGYKHIYKNGKLVKTEVLSRDTYK